MESRIIGVIVHNTRARFQDQKKISTRITIYFIWPAKNPVSWFIRIAN